MYLSCFKIKLGGTDMPTKYKYKNKITQVSKETEERLVEVKFWLITREMLKVYGDTMFTRGVIENIAMLSNCKISNINAAIEHLNTPIYKPKPVEIVLLNSVKNVNIRALVKTSNVANKTMYHALDMLEESGTGTKEILRTLEVHLWNDIMRFNGCVKTLFKNIADIA